ncbi:MAG TPA: type IV toxin-antitoxin system AbiEi family antitoxin domain-containing protein, partial [Solirubrobacterales bacterium]|nr:type IV toxin-antitoxin system AbiEi family antitoxin domain-containing protein [Solirubrobacterales bacterium]
VRHLPLELREAVLYLLDQVFDHTLSVTRGPENPETDDERGRAGKVSGLVVAVERKGRTPSPEALIRGVASETHGVVTRRELLGVGLTPEAIRQRVDKGFLLPVHRGVYRVGHHAPSLEARYMAAVKACGDGALVAGRAAAHLWRLIKGSPPQPEVLTSRDRRVRNVRVHRARRSELPLAVLKRGIPVTSVPRTLVDLASSLPEPALARACHEAGVLYRTTPRHVDAVLYRLPNAPGRRKLERVLHGEVPVTLSRLEDRFLKLLRKAGLPLPITNKMVDGRRVDCRWQEHRLSVELDSYRYHQSRYAWEQDHRRECEAGRAAMTFAVTRQRMSSISGGRCSSSWLRPWAAMNDLPCQRGW